MGRPRQMPGAFRAYKYAEGSLIVQFTPRELEFLSAWAREEKAVDPYLLPAHQLQAANHVRGVSLIRAIKAWARAAGRRDEDIFDLCSNPSPCWPWSSKRKRLQG